MLVYYIFIFLLILLVVIPFLRNNLKKKRDYAKLSQIVHQATDQYCFLVDKEFHVKETNFYQLNENIPDDQPYVLGNVLHCQTGCDSGLCGTGIACASCPVRTVLKNSFKRCSDFKSITATMNLYDENHEPQAIDVKVDGQFVYIGYDPHFLVNVRKSCE